MTLNVSSHSRIAAPPLSLSPPAICDVNDNPLLPLSSVKYESLDLFMRSFLGTISTVWSTIPLTLRERRAVEGWSAVRHLLQRYFNW